jgi:hypothetical protein
MERAVCYNGSKTEFRIEEHEWTCEPRAVGLLTLNPPIFAFLSSIEL